MGEQIISQEGYDKLLNELNLLTTFKRREIAERIQRAKDMGDLSENAEYSEAKEAQAFNEGRIAELSQMLKNLTVVEQKQNRDRVSMGSIVTAVCNGKEKKFEIVSFNEADPVNGKISNESPLGRAFINRAKNEKVTVVTPKGENEYEIIAIK